MVCILRLAEPLFFLGGSLPFSYQASNFFLYWLTLCNLVIVGKGDKYLESTYVAQKPYASSMVDFSSINVIPGHSMTIILCISSHSSFVLTQCFSGFSGCIRFKPDWTKSMDL